MAVVLLLVDELGEWRGVDRCWMREDDRPADGGAGGAAAGGGGGGGSDAAGSARPDLVTLAATWWLFRAAPPPGRNGAGCRTTPILLCGVFGLDDDGWGSFLLGGRPVLVRDGGRPPALPLLGLLLLLVGLPVGLPLLGGRPEEFRLDGRPLEARLWGLELFCWFGPSLMFGIDRFALNS